jgi:uncharacterized protein DUF5715
MHLAPSGSPVAGNGREGEAMRGTRRWMEAALAGLLAAGGCTDAEGGDAGGSTPRERPASVAPPPAPPPPLRTAADSAAARARIAARADSVRAAFARGRVLGAREVAELRQDVNAEQVATARRLGVRASGRGRIERLRRAGRLVALGDSTPYWVLRDMDHSVPYVTRDTRTMLVELGRRFHARLDRLGLPRYRMKVTSALRTARTQEELRKINTYASATESAHEFGTTVDVSHERFAVPANPALEMEVEMLQEVEKENAKVLQAELGRAIAELRDRGALHVMMENRQPVYHMTVARRFRTSASPR